MGRWTVCSRRTLRVLHTPKAPVSSCLPVDAECVALQLVSRGSFERVLDNICAWGKQYGWEPATLRNGAPQPPVA